MRSRRGTSLVVVTAMVVSTLALVFVPAGPAAADHVPAPQGELVGAGNLAGTELVENQFLDTAHVCFNTTQAVYGLAGEGTIAGRTLSGDPVVYRAQLPGGLTYQGPLKLEVENTALFYHGPNGTHGTDNTCSSATLGSPVVAVFRLFAPDQVYRLDGGGAQVPCLGHGSFVREGAAWHANWTLDDTCTVVGNAAGTPGTGTAPAGTAFTVEGIHDPCFGSCVDNFHDLTYGENLPLQGLSASLGGPASIAINRPAAMTAVVAYDGVALPGATVGFSVAGPGTATPSSGTATTGSNGQAGFSFTAAVEGDYVVTATATSSTYPGEERTATFTVFFSGPRPRLVFNGHPRAQNGDVVLAEAQLFDDSDPVANSWGQSDPIGNVIVNFSVSTPPAGQALPASGSAVTDATAGIAPFNFTATRAGTYTVTASATYAGQTVSTTHDVEFVVKTISQVTKLNLGSFDIGTLVMDPSGDFGYVGRSSTSSSSAARVKKIDMNTFTQVGGDLVLDLANKEWTLGSAVIDPEGDFAYFGTGRCVVPSSCGNEPGRVVKIDLHTFTRVGAVTLNAGEKWFFKAAIDPAGDYAYFVGTDAKVVKIDLNTFQRVGVMTTPQMPGGASTIDIDPSGNFGYFGGVSGANGAGPGWVVKFDLSTMQQVDELELPADGDRRINFSVIDSDGHYGYYAASSGNVPTTGWIIKIDLQTLERVDAVPVPNLAFFDGTFFNLALRDPGGRFAYFGAGKRVIKVELATLEMTFVPLTTTASSLQRAMIDPAGEYAYFGTGSNPDDLLKVDLIRDPKPALVAGNDSYATPYVTPLTVAAPGVLANDTDTEDADPLTVYDTSDPAGGSVDLNPDGSFTYTPDIGFSGTDTFTYQATDGIDLSPPATVSITVSAPPAGVQSVSGGACAYYTDVSLFGGPSELRGCGQSVTNAASSSPSVTLAPTGSTGPITGTKPEGAIALYGPAAIFSGIWPEDVAAPSPSGPLSVSTEGTTGPGGSATSSAHAVLYDTPLPVRCDGDATGTTNCTAPGGIGPGPLIANEAHSTCTADESGLSASATFVEGILETKYDVDTQLPIEFEDIPENPTPNYTREGTIDHVGDSFRVVFNEQIVGPDSITVNAAHMYLLGPIAVGDMIVGQSRCGAELAPPTVAVTASPLTVTAGDSVTAAWSAIAAPGPTDWVGLYPASDTPNPGLISWAYTNGAPAGSLNLPVPANAPLGTTYELRLFTNNSYDRLGTSAPFSVVASATAIAASPSSVNPGAPVTASFSGIAAPTATDWVGLYDSSSAPEPALLNWAYTGGAAAGSVNLFVPGSAPLGTTYELRLFTNNSYTRIATSAPFTVAASTAMILASPSSVNPGAPLTATWSGIAAPTATDWVGLYDSSSTPNPGLLNWAYTNASAAGSLNLVVPAGAPLGSTYELRLFTNNTYTRLATSAPFSVAASTATISASPASVANGSPVTATWSGVAAPTATDWVGLYASSGDPDPAIVAWAYTGGAAAGSLNLTVPAGSAPGASYELRLYSNNSYTRLAGSGSFTVT